MIYHKLICHINKTDLELLTKIFFNNGCIGTEVKEKLEISENIYGEIHAYSEKNVFEEDVILIGYFDNQEALINIIKSLCDIGIILLDKIKIEKINYDATSDDYKDNFKEVAINDDLMIVPAWYVGLDSQKIIVKILPGLGYGTGYHPNTQLAILNFLDYYQEDDDVLDFGCGSGIIAIIAKKYGIKKVYGIDIDASALKNAEYNVNINNVDVILRNDSIDTFPFVVSLIIANITYEIITNNLLNIYNHLTNNGILIISGILSHEKMKMYEKLKTNNFTIVDSKTRDNWISIVVRKEE